MSNIDDLDAEFERLRKLRKDHGQKKAAKASTPVGKAAKTAHDHDPTTAKRDADHGRSPPRHEKSTAGTKKGRQGASAAQRIQPTPPPTLPDALTPATADEAPGRLFGRAPPPFVKNPRTIADHPKNHAPGTLKMGESVWYNNERYWITAAPESWDHTSFVQIADKFVRPGTPVPDGTVIVSVHADMLAPAPVIKSALHVQPTKDKIEKRERMKAEGVTDIGDEVAILLRGKDLDGVYKTAAKFLGEKEEWLRQKFGHLNNGQQRMQCGNRMRNRARKR